MQGSQLLVAVIFITTLFMFGSAQGAARSYGAHLEHAQWRVSEYSPLQCTLEHEIPRYGTVRFHSEANRELNMRVVFGMRQLPDTYNTAEVYSVAPQWRLNQTPRYLGDLPLYRQYESELGKTMSWVLLSELEKGMVPTLRYQDWYNTADIVQVQISAINFHERYDDFMNCVANLLPFGFDDIAFSVLNYEAQTTNLTNASKRKLLQVGEYLKHDQNIELVLVTGYSDAYGSYEENRQLSIDRAQSIKDFLVSQGLAAEQISIQGHGEMRHISGNDNEIERKNNRRVVVQINRPFAQHLLTSR